MCGIAGFLDFNKKMSSNELEKMSCAVAHRGPDGEGIFYKEEETYHIGLAHKRLSIIDLSAAANQPFYSHDGRYVMIFNGEMYNFKEVAAKYHITPRTSSDSEILLEAF